MRLRTAGASLAIAGSVLCALTGCSTIKSMGFDTRDWDPPKETPVPELSEDEALTACVEAVIARFEVKPSSAYPAMSAEASIFNDDWLILAAPSPDFPELPNYYCFADGTDVTPYTVDEYQQKVF